MPLYQTKPVMKYQLSDHLMNLLPVCWLRQKKGFPRESSDAVQNFGTLFGGNKENGVFSFLKSRRVQTSDQTIRKMTMPASLYLPTP